MWVGGKTRVTEEEAKKIFFLFFRWIPWCTTRVFSFIMPNSATCNVVVNLWYNKCTVKCQLLIDLSRNVLWNLSIDLSKCFWLKCQLISAEMYYCEMSIGLSKCQLILTEMLYWEISIDLSKCCQLISVMFCEFSIDLSSRDSSETITNNKSVTRSKKRKCKKHLSKKKYKFSIVRRILRKPWNKTDTSRSHCFIH